MWKKISLWLLLTNTVLFAIFSAYRLYPEYLFSQGWIVTGTRLAPWEWEYQLFVGNEMARRQDYKRAADYYRRTLKYAPFLFVAANNLGLTQVAQGRFDLAEAIWWEVLAADPGNPDALHKISGLRVLRLRALYETD